jgi:hypothetical protein
MFQNTFAIFDHRPWAPFFNPKPGHLPPGHLPPGHLPLGHLPPVVPTYFFPPNLKMIHAAESRKYVSFLLPFTVSASVFLLVPSVFPSLHELPECLHAVRRQWTNDQPSVFSHSFCLSSTITVITFNLVHNIGYI